MPFRHTNKCQGTTRNGTPCTQPAILGRERCKLHGGKAPRGIQSATYGTVKARTGHLPGSSSKFIPSKLAADYHQAKRDPERLSVLHEISLWASREQQLLKRFDGHDAGAAWPLLETAWTALETAKTALDTAQAQKDIPGMRQAYHQFQDALATGRQAITTARTEYGLWEEVKKVHTLLLALRTQEHKRLLELQRYWNSEQVAMRFGQFLHGLWESCNAVLPKEHIRPLLTDFQWRIRSLEAEFVDMSQPHHDEPAALPTTDDTTHNNPL